jgi:hypothetical protein
MSVLGTARPIVTTRTALKITEEKVGTDRNIGTIGHLDLHLLDQDHLLHHNFRGESFTDFLTNRTFEFPEFQCVALLPVLQWKCGTVDQ